MFIGICRNLQNRYLFLFSNAEPGTSDIHFSLVFSLVSCFNVINGLVLEVRGEDVIVF